MGQYNIVERRDMMSLYSYNGDRQFRPLSAWAYFGYALLFAIPVVGIIFLLVFTFDTGNLNRRSFARSYWCWLIIMIPPLIILLATGVISLGWFAARYNDIISMF